MALALSWLGEAFAQVRVRPYVRKDGTYVQGHYRTRPDSDVWNNYSTHLLALGRQRTPAPKALAAGNINPYTGKRGYVNPYRQQTNPYTNPFGSPYGTKMKNPYSW